MKRLFCYFLIFNSFYLFGQEQKEVLIFDECNVSVNRTLMKDINNENRNGFGFGLYKSFRSQKALNIKFGFEFNRVSFLKHNLFEGHLQSSRNVSYKGNCISTPIGIRVSFGKNVKFFIETGAYADIFLSTTTEGTSYILQPDSSYFGYKEITFNKSTKLSNSYGIFIGIGTRIPISKFEFILKPEYKFALKASESDYEEIYFRYLKFAIGIKLKNN